MFNWAKQNWDKLYLDPMHYYQELEQAVEVASRANTSIALFNYPRCHLTPTLRSNAVKSISDWKNYYPDECATCVEKPNCSGYFASSVGRLHTPPRSIL